MSYWDGMLGADLSAVPCARCGTVGQLHIELRPLEEPMFLARPLGSHSLSGSQLKLSANRVDEWPWMICGACHRESKGKYGAD